MDPVWQAIFLGCAILVFVIGVIVSWVMSPPDSRAERFNYVALGLALVTFVPFIIAIRAS